MGVLVKIGADMASFKKEMNKATKEVQKASKQFAKVGKTLTTNVTVPILGIATASMKVGTEFKAQMSKVQAISGATGSELQALEKEARRLGSTTKFSATEASQGLEYFAMAGYSVDESISALEPTLNLAIASGTDLAVTADIVSDAMTAFGMSANETANFTDLLASVSTKANTNVEMLGESFKYVAPISGALGISAEDTAMALGLMANAGIKGSQAGTSLRTALTNLSNPTKQMSEAMNEAGIAFVNNADGSINLKGTMDKLRGAMAGMTEEQQASTASSIFGKNAMAGMLAIVNAGEEDYNKLTEATTNYKDSARDMAAIMSDNLKGSLDSIKSSLAEAGITISEILTPAVQMLAEFIQGLVNKFNGLDETTKRNIVTIAMIVASIGPLLLIVSKAMLLVGKLKFAFSSLKTSLMALNAPILAIVAVIAVLVASFTWLWNTNEDFRKKVTDLWAKIQGMFQTVMYTIKLLVETVLTKLQEAWSNNSGNIQGIVQSMWDLILTVIETAVNLIEGVMRVFMMVIQGDWETAWLAMKWLLSDVWEGIKNIFKSALDFVANIFGMSFDEMYAKATEKIENIKAIFEGLKDKIKSVVDGIIRIWKGFKLPTFSLKFSSKTFFGKEVKYPTGFKTSWHADGGIFTKPTVIGNHGFGEAGKEAILPLNKLPKLLNLDDRGTANIYFNVDGYTLARVMGEPLREQMNIMAGSAI